MQPNLQALELFARFATSSGKHTQAQIWLRRWKQEPWLKHLSGLTFTPSQAQSFALLWAKQAALTFSLEASRVNRTASPESNSTQGMSATFLGELWRSSASLRLNGSPWKTSQDSLFETDSDALQKGWKAWATEWRQCCSRLRTLVQATAGNGCSSWQTPTGSMMSSRRQVGAEVREALLPLEAQQWRTPSCGDPEGGVMEIRPASSGKYKLRDDAVNWATPQAFDAKDVTRKTPTKKAGCRTLANDLAGFSLPPETRMTSGGGSCDNDRTSLLAYRALRLMRGTMKHRLNPLFAEWLMGWPERWSTVTTDSGSSGTEWCRYKRQLHTAFCSLLSGVESNG